MKYLITEGQFDSVVQKLINNTLNEFRDVCEDYDEGTYPPDFLNWDDCDTLESIEKIEVVNTQTQKPAKGFTKNYPTIGVDIDIYFSNIFVSKDFSDFLIALAYRINQKYRVQLNLNENELINTNTNRQW
jgi:hypothetical protein